MRLIHRFNNTHAAEPSPSRSLVMPMAAVAVVALLLAHAPNSGSVTPVHAQSSQGEPLTTTPFNAAEQRKSMIDQLRQVNERLARIESKLAQPLDVRVKEMPPIVIPPANAAK